VARNAATGSSAHALERRSRAGRHLTVAEAMQGLCSLADSRRAWARQLLRAWGLDRIGPDPRTANDSRRYQAARFRVLAPRRSSSSIGDSPNSAEERLRTRTL
jgi:hypothetical protein